MISYIKGILAEKMLEGIVVEANGIGYYIWLPVLALQNLPRTGQEVKIYTYLHVKEDLVQLYGFLRREDREMFELMLRVNGIGPKGALGILSGMTSDELRFAILASDAKTIAKKASGVGVKTAQKMILELKDKLHLEDAFESSLSAEEIAHMPQQKGAPADPRSEAVLALTALGYANAQALRAVSQVEGAQEMTVEELLKASLKYM